MWREGRGYVGGRERGGRDRGGEREEGREGGGGGGIGGKERGREGKVEWRTDDNGEGDRGGKERTKVVQSEREGKCHLGGVLSKVCSSSSGVHHLPLEKTLNMPCSFLECQKWSDAHRLHWRQFVL